MRGSSAARLAVPGVATLTSLLLLVVAANAEGPEAFDHFRTSFPLVGAHERITCESCHRGGLFEGTPTRCFLCHDGSGVRAQTSKDFDHIRSTDDCDDCHLMHAWVPSRIDHSAVRGNCFVCHNGAAAEGKSINHVQSSNDCESCHRTVSWQGARFDHAGVTSSCQICHDGQQARGKSGDHIQSSNDCEQCHNTRNWDDADFDHSGATGNCSSCHDGTVATGVGDGHFLTSADCVECHSTARWEPSSFLHRSGGYPGDHAERLDCTDCHRSNSAIVSWERSDLQPDCAACHVSDFEPGPHKKQDSPRILYTASELRDCAGSCHIERPRSGEHSVHSREW